MRVYLNSIVVALLAVAFCTACAVTRSQTTSNGDIPTVTACQLVQDPERFHQKVVRVTGIFENEFERSYFYDLNCKKLRGAHPEIWAASHKSFVFEGDSDEAKKNKTISGSVVGR